ncbi:MAG: 6,7-dimethyl-8-ribityllumazine synthase [Deltaproteobacteria bacterium CG07_land_8_20_14_0_80_38_7]|nr:MAG: 6,7-dimethyl-8-ribityllumazine synthase [Deltaproteobacteria bacterium CG07_land_8_20_14_0_80_38_7]
MVKCIEGNLSAKGCKLALVVARFNDFITSKLLDGALDTIYRSGGEKDGVTVVKVPGSFEIPLLASKLASSGRYDGVICLGAIIRGSTSHHEHIATQLSKGLHSITLKTGVPVGFGVITAENLEQAIERAGTKHGNKGSEAALSVIEMINVLKQLEV